MSTPTRRGRQAGQLPKKSTPAAKDEAYWQITAEALEKIVIRTEKANALLRNKNSVAKARIDACHEIIATYQETVKILTGTLESVRKSIVTDQITGAQYIHPGANMASFAAQLTDDEEETPPTEDALALPGYFARLDELWNGGDVAQPGDFVVGTAPDPIPGVALDDTPLEDTKEP